MTTSNDAPPPPEAPGSPGPAADPGTAPPGFEPFARPVGGYFRQLGPIWQRDDGRGGLVLALRVSEAHTNIQGYAHGGMLLTVADGALGINVVGRRQPRQAMVTVSLSSEFLSGVRPGDWLEAHVSLLRMSKQLGFADCMLRVGPRDVLRASGVFAVVDRAVPALDG
jgi:acyl-coenzyme A thioesterase PaaI-like protein